MKRKSLMLNEEIYINLQKMVGYNGCKSIEDVIEFLFSEFQKHEEFKVIKEAVGGKQK